MIDFRAKIAPLNIAKTLNSGCLISGYFETNEKYSRTIIYGNTEFALNGNMRIILAFTWHTSAELYNINECKTMHLCMLNH